MGGSFRYLPSIFPNPGLESVARAIFPRGPSPSGRFACDVFSMDVVCGWIRYMQRARIVNDFRMVSSVVATVGGLI